jgi:hypothetical protein
MPTAINHRFRQYVAVERFELIGRTPDWLSRYDIGKSYDLGNGRRQVVAQPAVHRHHGAAAGL